MAPNLVKLTEQDKTALAELYIGEMETRFLQERPYFNSIELGSDIIKRQECSVRDGMDVVHILVRAHRAQLVGMGYEVTKEPGTSFYLKNARL